MPLIVQKFGGVTISTTAKIEKIAARIAEQKAAGDSMIIVVSAMGDTTDRLMRLAHELSDEPPLRDLDLLLNTGEMVSMALLSVALNSKGCQAIGLCGHQAGIQTNQTYANASITEIENRRILESIKSDHVVVIAGFQGATSGGDLTTLGRGGSDTTALAIAASVNADRCEILKDVPAIFTADPRVIAEASPISELSYDQLLEMTYWGAKVLQYRSVEIAKRYQIPLYVGPAHSFELGTLITEKKMIEDSQVLALNSFDTVLQISVASRSHNDAIQWLMQELQERKIYFPQLLHSESLRGSIELFVTGPNEIMEAIIAASQQESSRLLVRELSSVTATCRGSTRPETAKTVVQSLESKGIEILNLLVSAMSVTVFVERALRVMTLQTLHVLIPAESQLFVSGERPSRFLS